MLYFSVVSACLPILIGVLFGLFDKRIGRRMQTALLFVSLGLPSVAVLFLSLLGIRGERVVYSITDAIRLVLRVDTLGLFFAGIASVAFLLVAVFGLSYFHEDEKKAKFDCFFLLSYGAILLLCFAGNLLTMYFCFEAVTLCSMPMVLHEKTAESIDAAQKYLLYSVGGAFLGFIGIVYLTLHTVTDSFVWGGVLSQGVVSSGAFQTVLFLMLVGFGTKCGLFPLHNWLPTAHPVAPAPASALLSGIVTKSGVIAIIRIVFYTVGADNLKGTWAHTAWIVLILTTILLGSLMAAVQKNFKKRLAFSTVSQVSYVLLGLSVLTEDGLRGALLQICSHATIKICLFLTAGVLLHLLNVHNVDETDGIGKRVPVTAVCYTVCALGLVGVPPTSGFVAKWYIAAGALSSGLGALSVLAPIVLILSAILTAYYLLSVTISAFFPKDKTKEYVRVKEPIAMVLPLLILASLTVLLGIFASPIAQIAGLL